MIAQQHTRRLITLIFAGRSRMVMIRRELPRTECAGWVRKPFRTEREEGSPFRGPLRCHRRCCPVGQKRLLSGGFCALVLLFGFDRNGPDETQHFASDCRHDLVFVLAARCHSFVAFMQRLLGLPGNVLDFVADRQAFLPAEQEPDYVRPVLIRPGGFHQHPSEMAIAGLGESSLTDHVHFCFDSSPARMGYHARKRGGGVNGAVAKTVTKVSTRLRDRNSPIFNTYPPQAFSDLTHTIGKR